MAKRLYPKIYTERRDREKTAAVKREPIHAPFTIPSVDYLQNIASHNPKLNDLIQVLIGIFNGRRKDSRYNFGESIAGHDQIRNLRGLLLTRFVRTRPLNPIQRRELHANITEIFKSLPRPNAETKRKKHNVIDIQSLTPDEVSKKLKERFPLNDARVKNSLIKIFISTLTRIKRLDSIPNKTAFWKGDFIKRIQDSRPDWDEETSGAYFDYMLDLILP